MMLRKNQKALQMETPEGWKYVFCYHGHTNKVITTKVRSKALGERDLAYFSNKYGNDVFRVESAASDPRHIEEMSTLGCPIAEAAMAKENQDDRSQNS